MTRPSLSCWPPLSEPSDARSRSGPRMPRASRAFWAVPPIAGGDRRREHLGRAPRRFVPPAGARRMRPLRSRRGAGASSGGLRRLWNRSRHGYRRTGDGSNRRPQARSRCRRRLSIGLEARILHRPLLQHPWTSADWSSFPMCSPSNEEPPSPFSTTTTMSTMCTSSTTRPADTLDIGTWGQGVSVDHTFEEAGTIITLCKLHLEMAAYIVVVESPWFVQIALDGLEPAGRVRHRERAAGRVRTHRVAQEAQAEGRAVADPLGRSRRVGSRSTRSSRNPSTPRR